jgi:hypothetical protein
MKKLKKQNKLVLLWSAASHRSQNLSKNENKGPKAYYTPFHQLMPNSFSNQRKEYPEAKD